jgi:hypothetical protein
MKRNIDLPKTPIIQVNGRIASFRPQCSKCEMISDVPSPKGWVYKEGIDGGYICGECKDIK